VDWSIGTSVNGFVGTSDISSGTSATTNTNLSFIAFGAQLAEDTFALTGMVVPSTTNYLTLQNLSIPGGDPSFWDQNNRPSLAYDSSTGPLTGDCIGGPPAPGCGSESFQLYGSSSVPEPGAYALPGSIGLTGAALLRRRRRAR